MAYGERLGSSPLTWEFPKIRGTFKRILQGFLKGIYKGSIKGLGVRVSENSGYLIWGSLSDIRVPYSRKLLHAGQATSVRAVSSPKPYVSMPIRVHVPKWMSTWSLRVWPRKIFLKKNIARRTGQQSPCCQAFLLSFCLESEPGLPGPPPMA